MLKFEINPSEAQVIGLTTGVIFASLIWAIAIYNIVCVFHGK